MLPTYSKLAEAGSRLCQLELRCRNVLLHLDSDVGLATRCVFGGKRGLRPPVNRDADEALDHLHAGVLHPDGLANLEEAYLVSPEAESGDTCVVATDDLGEISSNALLLHHLHDDVDTFAVGIKLREFDEPRLLQWLRPWRRPVGETGLLREGAPGALHNDTGRIGTGLAAIVHVLVLHQAGKETADISIARAVGIHKPAGRELENWILRDLPIDAH